MKLGFILVGIVWSGALTLQNVTVATWRGGKDVEQQQSPEF